MSDKRFAVDFKLWSGGFITAYPLDEDREYGYFPEDEADSSGLDTTGHFLSIQKKPVPAPRSEEQLRQEKLFTDNAFLFLANYSRILSDSRMFLAPVYVRNGLAYSGYLQTATLGGYIELWLNCPSSVVFGREDRMSLVWFISGSPMSGANACSVVDEDGNRRTEAISTFYKLWTRFANIAGYYKDAKTKFEAYTLEEVVAILKRETSERDYRWNIRWVYNFTRGSKLQEENDILRARCSDAETRRDDYQKKWYNALFLSRKERTVEFFRSYMRHEEDRKAREDVLKEEKSALKRRLKNNELSNKECQIALRAVQNELSEISRTGEKELEDGIASLFPELLRFGEESWKKFDMPPYRLLMEIEEFVNDLK